MNGYHEDNLHVSVGTNLPKYRGLCYDQLSDTHTNMHGFRPWLKADENCLTLLQRLYCVKICKAIFTSPVKSSDVFKTDDIVNLNT